MAPRRIASAIALSELTPTIAPRNPAFLSASPNELPIRPAPTIATVSNSDTPADRWSDHAKLAHQLAELLREQGLRAVAERMIGIVMDFDQQPVRARGDRGARHRRGLFAGAPGVRRGGARWEKAKHL